MTKAKIAVLASGGGTNFQALIDSVGSVIKSGEIVLLVAAKEGAYAAERARLAGIPHETVVFTKKTAGAFEARVQELFDEYSVDVVVLAGFLSILSESFTRRYEGRMLNIHPSLIPSFCGKGFYGLKVHEAALEYGVKVTGATVHYVNGVADGGEIIMQKAVDVLPGDTPETLQRRVMEQAEWVILPRAVELVCKKLLDENK